MTLLPRLVAAALIAAIMPSGHALADQLNIDAEEYAQLPADKQDALVTKMKEQGLLSEYDSVKYVGAPLDPAKTSLGPAVLITLVPSVCKVIATAKKTEDLGKCAAKEDAAAQEQCKTETETKFGAIESVCNAIKLF